MRNIGWSGPTYMPPPVSEPGKSGGGAEEPPPNRGGSAKGEPPSGSRSRSPMMSGLRKGGREVG